MASYLYRLGRWAFRRRRVVLAFWLALLVGMGVLSQAVKKDTNDAFNVPGTESQRALDLLDEKFPGSGGATARIVFAAPEGHTLDEEQPGDHCEGAAAEGGEAAVQPTGASDRRERPRGLKRSLTCL